MTIKYIFRIIPIYVFLLFVPFEAMSEYVFTAPPRESVEAGKAIYGPIADFLTKKTGELFIYRHPENWASYSKGMQNNEYDMAFDGPHFVSWRIKNIHHQTIIKLPQLHIWRVVALKDNSIINSIDDLVGRKVCAPKSPNFGMLTMMSHFSNPERQPVHIITKGWKDGFEGVIQGKCEAAVLPRLNHKKFDPAFSKTKAIHTHLPYPNQAFTIGPRLISNADIDVRSLLLSTDGQKALSRLRARFGQGVLFVSAENEEYEGISLVLKRAGNFLSSQ